MTSYPWGVYIYTKSYIESIVSSIPFMYTPTVVNKTANRNNQFCNIPQECHFVKETTPLEPLPSLPNPSEWKPSASEVKTLPFNDLVFRQPFPTTRDLGLRRNGQLERRKLRGSYFFFFICVAWHRYVVAVFCLSVCSVPELDILRSSPLKLTLRKRSVAKT